MSKVAEQKCPNCGGPMRFDPATGLMVCDYCGTQTKIDPKQNSAGKEGTPGEGAEQNAPESTLSGVDFDALLHNAEHVDAADLPIYNCVSCGAEIIAPPEQAALTCPYCGNNIVLTDKVSGKLRPDGVIPFRIQAKDLPDAVNRYYRDKKLLPKGFFSKASMSKVTGVYVPFWVFDGHISGTINLLGTTVKSRRSGDYVVQTTSYYDLVRSAALDFKDLPVDAGSKMDDKLMDSLEPFDSRETKAFDMRYLAGFTADRFDQGKDDMAARAKKRMSTSVHNLCDAQASYGYATARPKSYDLTTNISAKYVLFPVYLFSLEHEGQTYPFAVNGQTGKVVGELPTSTATSALYFFKRFGLVSGILIALTVGRYFLGL